MKKNPLIIILIVVLALGIATLLGAQGMMGQGRGMMGSDWGMMGPGMGMMGMMGGAWDYIPPDAGESLTIEEAAELVEEYLETWGTPDLELEEVMEFSNNFYAEVEEESTGIHAFELLVNKYTGAIFPEPGPNMMWNTKYGHMGGNMMGYGMMGGSWRWYDRRYERQEAKARMKVSPEQAVKYAQKFLDTRLTGIMADEEVDTFYGYYTIHTMRDGKIHGMLSVNGYTGQVWYHSWHGKFVKMSESEQQGS